MKRWPGLLIVLLLAALSLVACDATGDVQEPMATEAAPQATAAPATAEAAPPTEEPDATAAPEASGCPTATDTTYLLRDPRHGFCLLYPTTHKVDRPNPDEVVLSIGSLLNTVEPRASVRVVAGDGLTAEAYADQIVADFEGFEIDRTTTTVAGEPAVVLDNVPGQDLNRQVIFTHEDRLYHLFFSPVDPANLEPIDALAQGILGSFTFMPVSETVTAEDECLSPKEGQQTVTSEAFDFCVLVPADFTFEAPSDTNANFFVGSMMDVEHPKLMIEVTDAGGRTAAEAADALLADFPDMGIQRSFGDTVGYEPAERLDGVPGQDLGRVLLAVHDDRLYRLTFVPADPTQGDVYTQMEALFNQVRDTWRFLP